MRIWLTRHLRTLGATLARFARSPVSSGLNVVVIGIALALPLALYVVLANLQHLARTHGSSPQLSVFLALDATSGDTAQLRSRLQQHPQVRAVTHVPRDQALRDLRASAGLAETIDSLPHNPLPDAFVIDAPDTGAETLEALRDEIRKWPKVAHVQLDSAWAKRLDALLRLGRFVLLLAAAALAAGVLAVTFNTIRLQILTQREEIEVSRLIGATDPFIRRPFLYFGALLGAAGGLTAWALIWAGVHLVNGNLGEIGQLYGIDVRLRQLAAADGGSLVVFSTALCWLGARLSVRQHLAAADPF